MSARTGRFKVDLRDIRFTLFEIFRIQDLLKFPRFRHLDLDQMESILAQGERMAVEILSPLNPIADQTPPRYEDGKVLMPAEFKPAFRRYAGDGWMIATVERQAGGWGLPESLGMALREMFNGACGGFYAFSSLTLGAFNLIQKFGTDAMRRKYVEKLGTGLYTGTMCLTEPHAGSFLADITTRARREAGSFKIKGQKTFIGTGEHDLSENIVHCVLARIEGAPNGYEGISLFLVPKHRVKDDGSLGPFNDVRCGGIEKKMGWDGAPTATLHFGESDDCQGWLLGEEGKGLGQIFHMINEMRLATAAQAVGQAAAVYEVALAFTKERLQGLSYKRKKSDPAVQVPIMEHPDIRRNLLFMKGLVEGCRRLIIQTALCIDLSKSAEEERDREHYQDLVEILTPICKAYSTDMAFRVAETAVQCMGGYGYVKEYGAEQYLRDLKVSAIYEGTNGIQAIDLQRRKLNLKGGQLFRSMTGEIDSFVHDNLKHPILASSVRRLGDATARMVETASTFAQKDQEDPGLPLSVAKPFLDLAGHVLCTWMLLRSAIKADALLGTEGVSEKNQTFYQGKMLTAQFAAANLLPQVDALCSTISEWDRSILDMEVEAF
jgi:hypothetical protein